jgi:hypothetical protein
MFRLNRVLQNDVINMDMEVFHIEAVHFSRLALCLLLFDLFVMGGIVRRSSPLKPLGPDYAVIS